MKTATHVMLGLALMALLSGGQAVAQSPGSMGELLDAVRNRNTERKREYDARVAEFQRDKQQQERRLRQAKTDLANENARSDR